MNKKILEVGLLEDKNVLGFMIYVINLFFKKFVVMY